MRGPAYSERYACGGSGSRHRPAAESRDVEPDPCPADSQRGTATIVFVVSDDAAKAFASIRELCTVSIIFETRALRRVTLARGPEVDIA